MMQTTPPALISRHLNVLALALSAILVLTATGLAQQTETARVTLVVASVPSDTPEDAVLTVGSNLNNWNPAETGSAFVRDAEGQHNLTLDVPLGSTLEYKVTLGSWRTAEVDGAGRDLPNRSVRVLGDTTIAFGVARWASTRNEEVPELPGSLSGTVETLSAVFSPQLGNVRDLLVYLPPSYASEPDRHYPVLYLQDGQNVFNDATSYSRTEWGTDETAEALAQRGLEVILVGIPNMGVERLAEYGPFAHPEAGWVAKGQAYAAFVAETVKPLIDATYRTLPDRQHTGMLGSSAGGVISLYTAMRYPYLFGFAGVMSPAIHLGMPVIFDWVKENPNPALRVWLDMGTEEGYGMLFNVQRMADLLEAQGSDVKLVIEEGAAHFETAWRGRFPKALEWFLTPAEPRISSDARTWLEQAVRAHGGDTFASLTGLRIRIENTLYGYTAAGQTPAQTFDIVLRFDLHGGQVRAEYLADGQVFMIQQASLEGGFFWTAETGTRPLPADAAAGLAENLYVGPVGLSFGTRGRDFAHFEGPAHIQGVSGEAVRVSMNGLSSTYLLSPDGTLLAERYAFSGGSLQTALYRDHREVGGIVFPFEVLTYVDETLLSRYRVLELDVNPEFSLDTFAEP